METISVKFLSEDFNLPNNLPQFVSFLQSFEQYSNDLIGVATEWIKETSAHPALPDIARFNNRFECIAKNIIAKLADNGVFDVTIDDLVKNNKGYKQFNSTHVLALQKLYEALLANIQAIENAHQRAYESAASQVTGSGISIWTSSLAEAFVFAALESSTVKQQTNAANIQLNSEIRKINAQSDDAQKRAERDIIVGFYYPEIMKSFAIFTSEALDTFLNALERNGKFEYQPLKEYNLIRSNELLKNLELVADKKALFRQAFICCPYNPDIYASLIDYDFADIQSFATARDLQQAEILYDYLVGKLRRDFKASNKVTFTISVLSLLKGEKEQYFYQSVFQEQVLDIQTRYKNICSIAKDDENAIRWLSLHTTKMAEEFIKISESKCKEVLMTVLDNIASRQLVEYLIDIGIISPIEICPIFSRQTKYFEIVGYICNELVKEIICVVQKVENHRNRCLTEAQKIKQEYDAQRKQYDDRLTQYQSDLQNLEKELKSAKLFDFSKKKQLKERISAIQTAISDFKQKNNPDKLKEQYERILDEAAKLCV